MVQTDTRLIDCVCSPLQTRRRRATTTMIVRIAHIRLRRQNPVRCFHIRGSFEPRIMRFSHMKLCLLTPVQLLHIQQSGKQLFVQNAHVNLGCSTPVRLLHIREGTTAKRAFFSREFVCDGSSALFVRSRRAQAGVGRARSGSRRVDEAGPAGRGAASVQTGGREGAGSQPCIFPREFACASLSALFARFGSGRYAVQLRCAFRTTWVWAAR